MRAKYKSVIFAILIIVLSFIVFLPVKSYAFSTDSFENTTSAKAMCLLETKSKRVLLEKSSDTLLPLASTTKIVTAITVLDNVKNIDEKFIVSDESIGVEGTSIYLQKGEKKTMRELLYGLMLRSGNDCATALAIKTAGSVDDFAKLMNNTALKCGATNSCFINPHGLDNDGHYTTAYDLALITSYALKNDTFREIVSAQSFKISGEDEEKSRVLKNKNRMLFSMDGCTGVKTGFTKKAGRCFVGSCSRNGMELVCVVLNCGPMFEDCERIINWGFDNYKLVSLLSSYNIIKSIPVTGGASDYVKLFSIRSFVYPLTEKEFLNIDYEYTIPDNLSAPVEKEKVVGTVEILLDNNLLFSENVYTMEEVKSFRVSEGLTDIIDNWF